MEGNARDIKNNKVYSYDNEKDIFWVWKVGSEELFVDKQYTGQEHYFNNLPNDYKEISLEEALEKNLITFERFSRMNPEDKKECIVIVINLFGISKALDFMCNCTLDFSEDEIKNIIGNKK
ncbi:MAG: hypothetical protein N2749_03580 [Clostridia bacterium]|nr:hypothetical protein [Clostridia bacterium]